MAEVFGFSGVPKLAKEFTYNPANILANTSPEFTVTVTGVRPGMLPFIIAPSLEANLMVGSAYVSAKDTLKFRISNPTVGAIDPASQVFTVICL